MKKSVIVVDLDGTLSNVNTFHAFVGFLVKQSFCKLKWLWLVAIFFWSGLRMLKLISHSRWKFEILKNCQNKNVPIDQFVNNLHKTINQFILDEIEKYDYRILATAAPELYVARLSEKYRFSDYSATIFQGGFLSFSENKQGIKYGNVKKMLEKLQKDSIDLFMTDHIDDALLISEAKKSWLINADKSLKKYIEKQKLEDVIVYISLENKI